MTATTHITSGRSPFCLPINFPMEPSCRVDASEKNGTYLKSSLKTGQADAWSRKGGNVPILQGGNNDSIVRMQEIDDVHCVNTETH